MSWHTVGVKRLGSMLVLAVALIVPGHSDAAIIAAQASSTDAEISNFNTPVIFSGPSVMNPPQQFMTGLQGVLRSATIRYDMDPVITGTSTVREQLLLLECVDGVGCSEVHARDVAFNYSDDVLWLPDPEGNELTVSFNSAIKDFTTPYTDGYPLDPMKKYQLRMQGQQMYATLHGAYIDGKFHPMYRLEGDAATSSEPEVCTERCNSNVMFLPGIQASRLYVEENGLENQVWEPNSLLGTDALVLDMSDSKYQDSVYVKDGDVIDSAYGRVPIYRSLIDTLNGLAGQDIFNEWKAISYDWRLDYEDLLERGRYTNGRIYYRGVNASTSTDPYIVQELKRLASTSRTGKVTIIAHSNGGLLAKEIVSRPELNVYIDQVVVIGSPLLGTPQAIGGLLHGYGQSLPFKRFPIFLSESQARELGQEMPMAYNLLPSNSFFQEASESVINFSSSTSLEWPQWAGQKIVSSEELGRFMTDMARVKPDNHDVISPEVVSKERFNKAADVHSRLDNFVTPSNIKVTTISGWGNSTLSSISYDKIKKFSCLISVTTQNCSAGKVVEVVYPTPSFSVDGDGTVLGPSVQWPGAVNHGHFYLNLEMLENQGGVQFSHSNLTEADPVLNLVSSIIAGESSPMNSSFISSDKPDPSGEIQRFIFTLYSPLTLGIYDELGRGAGMINGTYSSEIPGVVYERYGEAQVLIVPKSLSGRVVMRGTAEGSFAFDVREMSNDIQVRRATFGAILSSTTTVADFVLDPAFSPAQTGILNVDYDGNGVFETRLRAQEGVTVIPDRTSPEVVMAVSTSTKDLSFIAPDEKATVVKATSTYRVIDQAGNATTVFIQKQVNKGLLTYAKVSGINYGTSTIPVNAAFTYIWDSGQTPVSQTVSVGGQYVIEALFDKKKNKTNIVVLKKNVPIQVRSVPGLRLISLTSSSGQLNYSW